MNHEETPPLPVSHDRAPQPTIALQASSTPNRPSEGRGRGGSRGNDGHTYLARGWRSSSPTRVPSRPAPRHRSRPRSQRSNNQTDDLPRNLLHTATSSHLGAHQSLSLVLLPPNPHHLCAPTWNLFSVTSRLCALPLPPSYTTKPISDPHTHNSTKVSSHHRPPTTITPQLNLAPPPHHLPYPNLTAPPATSEKSSEFSAVNLKTRRRALFSAPCSFRPSNLWHSFTGYGDAKSFRKCKKDDSFAVSTTVNISPPNPSLHLNLSLILPCPDTSGSQIFENSQAPAVLRTVSVLGRGRVWRRVLLTKALEVENPKPTREAAPKWSTKSVQNGLP